VPLLLLVFRKEKNSLKAKTFKEFLARDYKKDSFAFFVESFELSHRKLQYKTPEQKE